MSDCEVLMVVGTLRLLVVGSDERVASMEAWVISGGEKRERFY